MAEQVVLAVINRAENLSCLYDMVQAAELKAAGYFPGCSLRLFFLCAEKATQCLQDVLSAGRIGQRAVRTGQGFLCVLLQCRGETGEAGVELLRVFDSGDDQHNPFSGERDCLNHQRDVVRVKSDFYRGLLHHFAEKTAGLRGSIGKFLDAELSFLQISAVQGTADLILTDSFYLQMITSYL